MCYCERVANLLLAKDAAGLIIVIAMYTLGFMNFFMLTTTTEVDLNYKISLPGSATVAYRVLLLKFLEG